MSSSVVSKVNAFPFINNKPNLNVLRVKQANVKHVHKVIPFLEGKNPEDNEDFVHENFKHSWKKLQKVADAKHDKSQVTVAMHPIYLTTSISCADDSLQVLEAHSSKKRKTSNTESLNISSLIDDAKPFETSYGIKTNGKTIELDDLPKELALLKTPEELKHDLILKLNDDDMTLRLELMLAEFKEQFCSTEDRADMEALLLGGIRCAYAASKKLAKDNEIWTVPIVLDKLTGTKHTLSLFMMVPKMVQNMIAETIQVERVPDFDIRSTYRSTLKNIDVNMITERFGRVSNLQIGYVELQLRHVVRENRETSLRDDWIDRCRAGSTVAKIGSLIYQSVGRDATFNSNYEPMIDRLFHFKFLQVSTRSEVVQLNVLAQGEPEVIKVLKNHMLVDDYKCEKAAYEILKPNISIGFYDESCVIELPYLGISLHDMHTDAHELTEHKMEQIIQQLIVVVAWMHQKNIIHNDIKSQNVLVTDETMYLIDLEMAQEVNSKTETVRSRGGTWRNQSYETLTKDEVSVKTDVWSMGTVIANLLFKAIELTKDELIQRLEENKTDPIKIFAVEEKYSFSNDLAYKYLSHMLKFSPENRKDSTELVDLLGLQSALEEYSDAQLSR